MLENHVQQIFKQVAKTQKTKNICMDFKHFAHKINPFFISLTMNFYGQHQYTSSNVFD